ncbi:DUF1795 domain-containing protein [Escherichia fergusonii]|uniref:DcrB-related protein n=1 Tax=Escherichia fergusonii TaxID=564 RepID=UPI001CBED77B|nr:DcrB-related protein [Escherichia fergusonii]MBZ4138045.1 DUF1795 domain-containing protein [Escherichia fergusonii]MBZ4174976.1 DUF1795 domain-containing protein [Escherichia fergusonii]UAW37457.1 DUF1795 domain-containing protein [Escherichia fergusonii]UAW38117.1 DUF1795 domain-containing protein [Escherichia fergusonii]
MNYITHEGTLTLPGCDGFVDETVNILKLPQHQASLVISRARLSEGLLTDVYLSRQIAKLKKDTRHFLSSEPVPVMLGDIPALELSCSFEKQNVKIYQQLLCTQQTPALLVLSFTRLAPLDEAATQWWQQVKASFASRKA